MLEYFFRLMEEISSKLEKAVNSNNVDEAEKLKKIILDMSSNIAGELI